MVTREEESKHRAEMAAYRLLLNMKKASESPIQRKDYSSHLEFAIDKIIEEKVGSQHINRLGLIFFPRGRYYQEFLASILEGLPPSFAGYKYLRTLSADTIKDKTKYSNIVSLLEFSDQFFNKQETSRERPFARALIDTSEGPIIMVRPDKISDYFIFDKDGIPIFGEQHHQLFGANLETEIIEGEDYLPVIHDEKDLTTEEPQAYDFFSIDGEMFHDESTVGLNNKYCQEGHFRGPHYWIDRELDTEVGKMLVVKYEKDDTGFDFVTKDGRNHWFGKFTLGLDKAKDKRGKFNLGDSMVARGGRTFVKRWKSDPEFNMELNLGKDPDNWKAEYTFIDIHNFYAINGKELKRFLSSEWDKYRDTYEIIRKWKEKCEFPHASVSFAAVEYIQDNGWLTGTKGKFGVTRKGFLEELRPNLKHWFLSRWYERVYTKYPRSGMDKKTFFEETVKSLRHIFSDEDEDDYWRIIDYNIEQSTKGGRVNTPWDAAEAARQIIPDYEVLQYLGKGSFKSVYLVKSKISDDLLAFKKIDPEGLGKVLISKRYTFMDWLEAELYIKELKDIDSPYVAKVQEPKKIPKNKTLELPGHEPHYSNFFYYLVEEPFEMTLEEKLEGGPLIPEESMKRAFHIILGLYVCNEKGVVHKDLKPNNIGIGFDGLSKLTDFGTLKDIRRKDGSRELTSIAYSPIEVIEGADVDYRANMFSAGIILWEMLRGKNPFVPDVPKPREPGKEKDKYNAHIKRNINTYQNKSLAQRYKYIFCDLKDVLGHHEHLHRALSGIIAASTTYENNTVYGSLDVLRRDMSNVIRMYEENKEAIFTEGILKEGESLDGITFKEGADSSFMVSMFQQDHLTTVARLDSYKDVMSPEDYEVIRKTLIQYETDKRDLDIAQGMVKSLEGQLKFANEINSKMNKNRWKDGF